MGQYEAGEANFNKNKSDGFYEEEEEIAEEKPKSTPKVTFAPQEADIFGVHDEKPEAEPEEGLHPADIFGHNKFFTEDQDNDDDAEIPLTQPQNETDQVDFSQLREEQADDAEEGETPKKKKKDKKQKRKKRKRTDSADAQILLLQQQTEEYKMKLMEKGVEIPKD